MYILTQIGIPTNFNTYQMRWRPKSYFFQGRLLSRDTLTALNVNVQDYLGRLECKLAAFRTKIGMASMLATAGKPGSSLHRKDWMIKDLDSSAPLKESWGTSSKRSAYVIQNSFGNEWFTAGSMSTWSRPNRHFHYVSKLLIIKCYSH